MMKTTMTDNAVKEAFAPFTRKCNVTVGTLLFFWNYVNVLCFLSLAEKCCEDACSAYDMSICFLCLD